MDKQILVRNATCLSIGMSVTAHCTFAISMCVFESTLTISGPHSFGYSNSIEKNTTSHEKKEV